MQFFSCPRVVCLASGLAAFACTGQVADSGAARGGDDGFTGGTAGGIAGGEGGAGNGVAGSGVGATECEASREPRLVPRVPLRRLTRDEYNNTIRDLLGDASLPAKVFAADERSGRFLSNSIAPLSATLFGQQQTAAEVLADRAVMNLPKIVPCDPKVAGDDACGATFISTFGKRAFRRPLDDTEIKRYQVVFATGKTGGTFSEGVRNVVAAMLQSPNFLYHVELGEPGAKDANVRLSSHDTVSRLSYFLWQSMPDDEAISLADKNAFLDADQVVELARRMLASPKFIDSITSFHMQWLGIDGIGSMMKDATIYPNYTPVLRDSMMEETRRFIVNWAADGDSQLDSLLQSPKTFLSKTLAPVYGIPVPVMDWSAVTLAADQRAGILTQPSVLSVHAHTDSTAPINRGRFVREALLCQPISPPPANINTTVPAPSPGISLRQRLVSAALNIRANPCAKA
jgi:Protein of unknown function (DUF1592)/Protein of unknown function (DUF1595)/Protein of unknown function (DUF1588)/Protein of unknown function (DUF1587)